MKPTTRASLMGGLMILATAGLLAPGPAQAVSPKVQAAIKSLEKIEADGPTLQSFCKLLRDIDDLPEQDEAKAEALEAQLDSLLRSIGIDVFNAWDLGSDLDPQSEDGQAFDSRNSRGDDRAVPQPRCAARGAAAGFCRRGPCAQRRVRRHG